MAWADDDDENEWSRKKFYVEGDDDEGNERKETEDDGDDDEEEDDEGCVSSSPFFSGSLFASLLLFLSFHDDYFHLKLLSSLWIRFVKKNDSTVSLELFLNVLRMDGWMSWRADWKIRLETKGRRMKIIICSSSLVFFSPLMKNLLDRMVFFSSSSGGRRETRNRQARRLWRKMGRMKRGWKIPFTLSLTWFSVEESSQFSGFSPLVAFVLHLLLPRCLWRMADHFFSLSLNSLASLTSWNRILRLMRSKEEKGGFR